AALTAVVTIRLPTTVACRRPPWLRTYAIARRPGSRREPDTVAASVSRRWHFARSATSPGNGRASAVAMYALSSRVIGEILPGGSADCAASPRSRPSRAGFLAPAKSAIGSLLLAKTTALPCPTRPDDRRSLPAPRGAQRRSPAPARRGGLRRGHGQRHERRRRQPPPGDLHCSDRRGKGGRPDRGRGQPDRPRGPRLGLPRAHRLAPRPGHAPLRAAGDDRER